MDSTELREPQSFSDVPGTWWWLMRDGWQAMQPFRIDGWPLIHFVPDSDYAHHEAWRLFAEATGIVVKMFDARKAKKREPIGDNSFDLPALETLWGKDARIVFVGCNARRMRRLLQSIMLAKPKACQVVVIGAGEPWSPVPVEFYA